SGAMNPSRRAGPAFVSALKVAQRQHSLLVDGKYGKDSHGVIAPHFTAGDVTLYKRAAVRTPEQPPAPTGNAATAAERVLEAHARGKYQPKTGDLADVEATAAGRAVRSQHGGFVHIDARVMRVLVQLIESGHTIGTSAICSDHSDDGPHGHAGGFAVD